MLLFYNNHFKWHVLVHRPLLLLFTQSNNDNIYTSCVFVSINRHTCSHTQSGSLGFKGILDGNIRGTQIIWNYKKIVLV